MELSENEVISHLKVQGKFDDLRKSIMNSILESKDFDVLKNKIEKILSSSKTPPPKESINHMIGNGKYMQVLTQYIEKE